MNTIKTGIKSLDKKLNGGLCDGSLTVIIGRPGMGKSSLTSQIAVNIAKSGKRVLLVNLETSEKGIRDRMSKQGFESSEYNMIICDEPNISVEEAFCYKLKEGAPKEAVKSYEEFYYEGEGDFRFKA